MSEELTAGAAAPRKDIAAVWVWLGVAVHVTICLLFPGAGSIPPPADIIDGLARAVGSSIPVIGLSILVLAPLVGLVKEQPSYCRYNVTIAVWVGLILRALI
jgi:hypothetical protein